MIPALLALALQTTPVAPIEKGTALPPPVSEEGQVIAPVQRLLAALANGDASAILREVRPDGRATALTDRGPDTASWTDFAQRPRPAGQRIALSLAGTPAVEIDGDIAMIWSPYVARIDGKVVHCGTDHVDMIRVNGAWKVFNMTWSLRSTDCPA